MIRMLLALALLLAALPARAAELRARIVEAPYAISGSTGAELYASIGARGPLIRGKTRTIAVTNFDLKWRRDYRRDGNDCVLRAATPFLTITYTLPEPAGGLPPGVAARWRVFIAGIREHEAVHGLYIREMAQDIYDTTVGFRQPDDPDCKAIRQAIQAPLKQAYARYKANNAAFEKREMAPGGPIHALVRGLIR